MTLPFSGKTPLHCGSAKGQTPGPVQWQDPSHPLSRKDIPERIPDLFLNSKEDSEYNFLLLQDLSNKREEFFKMYNNGKFGDFTYRDFKVNKIVKEIDA